MQISHIIQGWIQNVLKIEKPITLVHPKDLQNGDFTFIVNDGDVEKYFETLKINKIEEIEEIKLVAPRFINFFLSKSFFVNSINEINEQGENFGKNNLLKGKKIIVEYTNTNVLKPLHIGHLMGNVIGESLSSIFESSGAIVKRNTYQGDTGLHIAKCVWGIVKMGGVTEGSLQEKVDFVGKAYAFGANKYEDNIEVQEEIKDFNKKIFDKSDEHLVNVYKWAKEVSLAHFEDIYKKLGTKFDYYFFESEVAEKAILIVKDFLKKSVFEESEGAIVFRGENFDPKLHTRVFISSQGIPMYEAKDIAHALRKEEFYKSDKSIIITANEQNDYFKVVFKALEQINPEVASKTEHLSHGILKLSSGKMSSRKGNVITGESLIEDTENMVFEKISTRDYSLEEKNNIKEEVAIGAIKFSILRQAIGGDIVFDFEKSISFEGDSGPYLQYTAVRANSVLEKACLAKNIFSKKSSGLLASLSQTIFSKSFLQGRLEQLENFEITELEKMLYRFPEVVERAGREYAPHYLVTYLIEVAGAFNSFYASNKILDAGEDSEFRLALTRATYIVLENGLKLLSIKVPKRM